MTAFSTRPSRIAAGTAALLLLSSLAATPAQAADSTSRAEALRVDRVKVTIDWYACGPALECATVNLPRDYDDPRGPTVEVALARVKAKDQKRRLGSLFVNPGGPGGSGVQMAASAPYFLGQSLLDRFDIVGMDPRGIGFSQPVQCFTSLKTQTRALGDGLQRWFPWTKAETAAYLKSSKAEAQGCSTTGRPLSASMSTAQVARDMDVVRRAVGDKKLTYLGFSYGSYLGGVYANLFPDRVRAVTIDGVLDPVAWAGTWPTAATPVTLRIKSAEGAHRALTTGFARCKAAGAKYCHIAADPAGIYKRVADGLKKKPLEIPDEESGETLRVTYADFVGLTRSALYGEYGMELIDAATNDLDQLMRGVQPTVHTLGYAAVRQALAKQAQQGYAFPYDNSLDAFSTVLCTDSLNPRLQSTWEKAIAANDKVAPHFARIWGWQSVTCARQYWTAQDEDSYRGPFTKKTAARVLVVGNYYDPATNYTSAVTMAKLMPNSTLLSSDSWGHTAYGTSACVTDAVTNYLLTGKTPASGTVCQGNYQPFRQPLEAVTGQTARDARKGLPPVVPPAMPLR